MPKRCYVKWLAAKAMLCEVACCQSYVCYVKWLAAKAVLCEVAWWIAG